jgi:hypothetical protein
MSKTYKLHPLTDTKKPYGVIWFIHEGKEQEFYSVVNEMSGSRLSAFNSDPPSIDDQHDFSPLNILNYLVNNS